MIIALDIRADMVAEFGNEKSESLAGSWCCERRHGAKTNQEQDCPTRRSRKKSQNWSSREYDFLMGKELYI